MLVHSNISERTLGLTFLLSSVAHVGRGQIAELAVARHGDEVVLFCNLPECIFC